MSKLIGIGILGALGLIAIVGASIFLGLFHGIIDDKIKEVLPLKEGSATYNRWKNLDVPIYMKFHIFQVKNVDKFNNFSDIEWVERGPYVFEETRIKGNIIYSGGKNNNTFVTYEEHKIYIYNQKLSKGLSLDEEVHIINLPVLGIIYNSLGAQLGLGGSLYNMEAPLIKDPNQIDLFTKRKVGDIIFDGFDVELFKKLNVNPIISPLTGKLKESFSVMDKGKYEVDEPWTVYTGIDSMDKYGQIYEFDDLKEVKNKEKDGKLTFIWRDSDKCHNFSTLKGTDGTMFSPKVSKSEVLYAFEPQLCRTVFFYYGSETSVRDIDTYRFWVPDEYFQSPIKNKENECYCIKRNVSECTTNGVLEITNCKRLTIGAPVVMSAPYFLHGDKELRDMVNLHPKPALNDQNYGTYLDVEPLTGTVLGATRRIQINIKLDKLKQKISSFPNLTNIMKLNDLKSEILVPALWLEETAEADEQQADQFKAMVTNKLKLGIGIAVAFIVIGFIMSVTAIVLFVRHKRSINNSPSRGRPDLNRNYKS